MDEAKDYFLKYPELNCTDTALWGRMQGQTPATYTSRSQRKEEPYKWFPIGYERVRVPRSAMHHTPVWLSLPELTLKPYVRMMRAFLGEWKQMEYQILVLSQNSKHSFKQEWDLYKNLIDNAQLDSEAEMFSRVVFSQRVYKDDSLFLLHFSFLRRLGQGWRCANKMLFCHSGITL